MKVEIEREKLADTRRQFYFDWGYKSALAVLAVILVWWAIPQFSEISVPFAGGSFTAKRAPKETAAPQPPGENAVEAKEVAEALKKGFAPPGPTTDRVVDRLEEAEVLQVVGVQRDTIYICHRTRPVRGTDQYRLHIYLDADSEGILDKVDKVVYRLHPTFTPAEATVTNRGDQFALDRIAWGEFMLYALVYFKNQVKPVELKRYLNF